MFSGLVRGDAKIAQIDKDQETITLTVRCAPDFIKNLKIGDSIAINGTCLYFYSHHDAANLSKDNV